MKFHQISEIFIRFHPIEENQYKSVPKASPPSNWFKVAPNDVKSLSLSQAGEKRWLVTRKLHQQVHKHKADLALTFDKRQKLEAHNQQPIQDNNDPPPA